MTSTAPNPHRKHAALARPLWGAFGRQEWALIGAPCGVIKAVAAQLIAAHTPRYRWGYVDASHQAAPLPDQTAWLTLTDNLSHTACQQAVFPNAYECRAALNACDAVLVNGNHFAASRQIVCIDPRKADSLARKTDRLTDVACWLLGEGQTDIFPFLKQAVPHWAALPVFSIADQAGIAAFIGQQLAAARPPVYGLVLAGGKSQRMGQDKGLLRYHDKPQREHVLSLLGDCCERAFVSCRPEQTAELAHLPYLADSFADLGPFGAILSAFRAHPNAAWLVVACDLPLLDATALAALLHGRDVSQVATAFVNPDSQFPEPLLTIWEPKSYQVLLQFLAQGYSCPRKVLINSSVALLPPPSPVLLTNANTPQDYENALAVLRHS